MWKVSQAQSIQPDHIPSTFPSLFNKRKKDNFNFGIKLSIELSMLGRLHVRQFKSEFQVKMISKQFNIFAFVQAP